MPVRYHVRLTPRALDDLDAIHDYLRPLSPQGAQSVLRRILDALDSLERFPHRTVVERRAKKLKFAVRSLPVKPYVIYFRIIEDERIVVIRHIRHGARRPPDVGDLGAD